MTVALDSPPKPCSDHSDEKSPESLVIGQSTRPNQTPPLTVALDSPSDERGPESLLIGRSTRPSRVRIAPKRFMKETSPSPAITINSVKIAPKRVLKVPSPPITTNRIKITPKGMMKAPSQSIRPSLSTITKRKRRTSNSKKALAEKQVKMLREDFLHNYIQPNLDEIPYNKYGQKFEFVIVRIIRFWYLDVENT